MDSKIKKITEVIYQDGIKKANEEADRILNDAKKQYEEIVKKAESEALEIVRKSQEDSRILKEKTEKELSVYANNIIENTKNTISEVICLTTVKESVAKALEDKDLIKNVILNLASKFDIEKGVEVSASQVGELKSFFEEKAKDLLAKGLTIKEINGSSTNFHISPSDGSYRIEFGDKEFEKLFLDVIRPEMAKMLFK